MQRTFGIEIPSIEHPRLLAAALHEAELRNVRIDRVTQGSGLRMLTDGEIEEMLGLAHAADVELMLFVSNRNSFDCLVDDNAGDQLRGEESFEDACAELVRCSELGIDGVLIADIGLLATAGEMLGQGKLGDLKLKSAAAIAPTNAAAAALYERLGASSINVSSGSSLKDLVAMRGSIGSETTLDLYVESPADFGGGLRYREASDIVNLLAPVIFKIGLRNGERLYPYGAHLEAHGIESTREKVRRVELLLGELRRAGAHPGGGVVAGVTPSLTASE